MKRGQQVFPDQVELLLHVSRLGRDGDDGVLFRQDDAELTVFAIASISTVSALPELKAVAFPPVGVAGAGSFVVVDLFAGGLSDPVGGDQLLVRSTDPSADRAARTSRCLPSEDTARSRRSRFPADWFPTSASRCPADRTVAAADNRRPSGRSPSARSPTACTSPACCSETSSPACAAPAARETAASTRRLRSSSGSTSWPVDMVSRSRTRIALRFSDGSGGSVLREEAQHLVVDVQLAFRDGESDGRRRKALAERPQNVRLRLRLPEPTSLRRRRVRAARA